jgi:hypothetical protein
VIAEHVISREKGKLIQDKKHLRDRSKGISAYLGNVSEKFEDKTLAKDYLQEIYQRYPRYVRDQLQIISKAVEADPVSGNKDLQECVTRGLYSAIEFKDMMQYLAKQTEPKKSAPADREIKLIKCQDTSILEVKAAKRDVQEYLVLLEGGGV